MQTDPVGYGYVYCGNNPLGYVDPSGLLRISFYDGSDEGWSRGANGDQFKEVADDEYFDIKVNMRPPDHLNMTETEWIIAVLDAIVNYLGYEVTDVYFFDHGIVDDPSNPSDVVGLEFGDEHLFWNPEGEEKGLEGFMKKLQNVTPQGSTLHFRHCYAGADEDKLKSLVEWSHRRVTGSTGEIYYGNLPKVYRPNWEPFFGEDGPDYYPFNINPFTKEASKYVQATPVFEEGEIIAVTVSDYVAPVGTHRFTY